ncbi:JAB domain-containing protein [Sorangium sp. So ce1151]|uniref:JAB domain-containing protein n=1 Tax=Sorangium sp. So ce1151 TaxID=3133332 RepID=UPI003F5FA97F
MGQGGAIDGLPSLGRLSPAALFVLACNHPSGDPTLAREDEAMTLELRHLSAELHVPLTAHVIVTPSGRYAAVHEEVSSRGAAPLRRGVPPCASSREPQAHRPRPHLRRLRQPHNALEHAEPKAVAWFARPRSGTCGFSERR